MKVEIKLPKRSKEECSSDCIFNYDCGHSCLLYGGQPDYFDEYTEEDLYKKYELKAVPECQTEYERQHS